MVYCVVPRESAAKLYGTLQRFYAEDASVEVVIEGRNSERRVPAERRRGGTPLRARLVERRRIQNPEGRRLADRRAVTVPALTDPPLPRAARRHAAELTFVAPMKDGSMRAHDLAVGRLALRIQGGDAAAFEDLYKTHFDSVYSYLRLALANAEDIEHALQDVFGHVLGCLNEFDPGHEPFRAWLGGLLFEFSCQEIALEAEPVDEDDTPLPDRWAGAHDLSVLDWLTDHDLLLLIGRLPAMQREVMALHYLFSLNSTQIAAIVGRAPDEIDKLHGRALRFMAGCLTSLGRRPGYSGRHPMRARVHCDGVTRQRQLALSR
jgi:RNA polymerase sigma-70 factor (ECF subfamily)